MARRMTVSISKGGVGKTTTAVHLAVALSRFHKKRVLLIDMDQQGQATRHLGFDRGEGTSAVLEGKPPETVWQEVEDGLQLLVGGRAISGARNALSKSDIGSHAALDVALSPFDDDFDYIIIDTNPGWDIININALYYAKEIVMPVMVTGAAVDGMIEFLNNVEAVKPYNKELDVAYVIPTFFDKRMTESYFWSGQLENKFNSKLTNHISTTTDIKHSFNNNTTIFDFAPASIGSKDYKKLAERIACDDK